MPARGHELHAERGQVATIRNLREHPIDVLLHRDLIAGYQHQAAEQFLSDWERAAIGGLRATQLDQKVDGARGGELTAAQVDALRRLNRTLDHLGRANRVIVEALVIGRENLARITARMNAAGWRWPPQRYAAVRVGGRSMSSPSITGYAPPPAEIQRSSPIGRQGKGPEFPTPQPFSGRKFPRSYLALGSLSQGKTFQGGLRRRARYSSSFIGSVVLPFTSCTIA